MKYKHLTELFDLQITRKMNVTKPEDSFDSLICVMKVSFKAPLLVLLSVNLSSFLTFFLSN